MQEWVKLREYPVADVLDRLIMDRTTGLPIIFAKEGFSVNGIEHGVREPMLTGTLIGFDSCEIQPRVSKTKEERAERTKSKAEVFTPSWLCNLMNNNFDTEWFGRENVFNTEDSSTKTWTATTAKISFPQGKTWQQYVQSTRLEITCGEAPFIVSRYDTVTGEAIPIPQRIGLLDRKLRLINENVSEEKKWLTWVYKAFQSCYGYEFQGDNLLIARVNLLVTFVDYMVDRWGRKPTLSELRKVTDIISWNFWQMDGLKGTVPYGGAIPVWGTDDKLHKECIIYDWQKKEQVIFNSIKQDEAV